MDNGRCRMDEWDGRSMFDVGVLAYLDVHLLNKLGAYGMDEWMSVWMKHD